MSTAPVSARPALRRRVPRCPLAVPVDVTALRSGVPDCIPGRLLDVGEGGVTDGHDRGIDDAESIGAVDASRRIDHRPVVRLRAHRAGPDDVRVGTAICANSALQLVDAARIG